MVHILFRLLRKVGMLLTSLPVLIIPYTFVIRILPVTYALYINYFNINGRMIQLVDKYIFLDQKVLKYEFIEIETNANSFVFM